MRGLRCRRDASHTLKKKILAVSMLGSTLMSSRTLKLNMSSDKNVTPLTEKERLFKLSARRFVRVLER